MEVLAGIVIGIAIGVIGTVEWGLCAAKKMEREETEEKKTSGDRTG